MPSNIIAIIGRPNVGKSTLFNRLVGAREAIVHDLPGVTRDRKYAETEWAGKRFTIIDTGGYLPRAEGAIERGIREQAEIAIREADAVLFVVDANDGVLELDREIANILRKSEKTVHVVVNKVDSPRHEIKKNEFYALGLGEPFAISALGGRQIGDFLDAITASFRTNGRENNEPRLRIAIIGKPNVGKSSLVNALLGKKRQLVTEIPGTTRDPIDSVLKYHGDEIILVDTAGLKKRRQMLESVEFYSALRTLKSIERSDVAVILFDADRGIDAQDLHIVETALARRRPSIIAVNKWDLVEKETATARRYEQAIRRRLGQYDYLPILFISALTKQRITKVVDLAKIVHAEQCKRIETSDLNEQLLPVIEHNPPKSSSPKEIKIKYVAQVKTRPPMFAFFTNHPNLVQESYKRFLEHKIREHFGFSGVPLTLVFKQK
jgi:GTP-binding protein